MQFFNKHEISEMNYDDNDDDNNDDDDDDNDDNDDDDGKIHDNSHILDVSGLKLGRSKLVLKPLMRSHLI